MNAPMPIQEIALQEAEVTEAQLVQKLRGDQSFREFETYLNESIPAGMPGTTTFASVWNWINGVHPVNGACLMAWMTFYPKSDERHQLAVAILKMRGESKEEHGSPTTEKKTKSKMRAAAIAA